MSDPRVPHPPLPAGLSQGLAEALDGLGVAWWIKDADGRYLHLSPAGHALLGVAPGGGIGRADTELLPHAVASALRAADQGAMQQSGACPAEHQIELGGQRRELSAVRVPLAAQAAGSRPLLGVWLDTSALHRREAELRDALRQLEAQQRAVESLRGEIEGRAPRESATRLVQREQFWEQLGREIDLSMREHREFAIVYVTLDAAPAGSPPHDAEGRARVLEALGGLLRGNTRAMDAPSRLEGERFALLLSGVGLATAHARMEGLRRQCATQLVARSGDALRFTVSMGVASFPHTAQTQAGLLQAAEGALQQAQERGGNHVALASIAFGAAQPRA